MVAIYHRENDSNGASNMPFYRFELSRLLEKGFACFNPVEADLVVTFRGTGLIDVFDAGTWHHVAFLDFDLQREIHLDSAFGSPLIGLPFPAALKQEKGVSLRHFEDLRQRHHYGFFVEANFRNKGARASGIWTSSWWPSRWNMLKPRNWRGFTSGLQRARRLTIGANTMPFSGRRPGRRPFQVSGWTLIEMHCPT